MKNELYFKYKNIISENIKKKFLYKSVMEIPIINKITINMGFGKFISEKKILETTFDDLTKISGQKPIFTKAKKSISNFKIRKGVIIGCKVTLRNKRMWSFIDKLICVVIPRIRDFRGFSKKSFDKMGNFNLGIKEHIIFPEINYDYINRVKGMDINFNIKSKSLDESIFLLKSINFPIKY
ncbi:50S ribosomal protein L5 [endosymbiont of Sipalinus gigas]|uniref:50S ribosomal protein L5 n=1 Tax=endosymbiont of Sipalinus gigas TaxID=1972134 RepID=UPI000DC70D30|nr:50S ribosomal protein L5 [endosymbiont of Sipalinus gigas]BBA85253.1 50S ribosomal protein L5 [endosymbiont of Sipalinus gigas]